MNKIEQKIKETNDNNCTYFLCEDKNCKLFESPEGRVPCERNCPKKSEMAIICQHCDKIIYLPYKHSSFRRVDCPHCNCINFQRMSGIYRRININEE